MRDVYVFDTEPIIAFLYEEPGHDSVHALLEEASAGTIDGRMTTMNVAEVFYLVSRFEGSDGRPTDASMRAADRDVRSIERHGIAFEQPHWLPVGRIKAHGGLSMADACAVAITAETDGTLLVGDDSDFDDLPVDITVEGIAGST